MPTAILHASNLAKVFNRRSIFSNINFVIPHGRSFAITGRNGSGKSTLVKILAGVISPNDGNFTITLDGTEVKRDDIYRHVGLVAPYLQLYEEFSAWENLDLFRKLRGVDVPDVSLDGLLEKVGLYKRKHDLVRTYSSGMKQRLKYAFALLHEPEVLLLDEPTSNLDAEGMSMVSEVIAVHRTKGIVIVATNVREEVQRCDASLDLDADPARQGVRS